jgi:hypothetical protein
MDKDAGIVQHMQAEDEAAAREREAKKLKASTLRHIEQWHGKLKRCRKHDQAARQCWADDRKVARGESEWKVSANLIGAIMEVLAAFLYAKNPDISAKPSPSADRAQLGAYNQVAETIEIVVSRLLRDAGLKRIAKRWVRQAMTVGVGWIKVAMQTRMERDPIIEERINDLRENISALQALQAEVDAGVKGDEDAALSTLEAKRKALEAQLERQIAEGIVLDLMAPEDVLVAPEVGEVEGYLAAPWIAFDMYKSREETIAIMGLQSEEDLLCLDECNVYVQKPRKGEVDEGAGSGRWVIQEDDPDGTERAEDQGAFYRFTEIWSKTDGVVYTLLDGLQKRWARDPYAPRTGSRYYPCFQLAFHYVDGERWPQSDVSQLKSLQDEYHQIRSNFHEHRRRTIPGTIFDSTQIDESSITKIVDGTVQEWVGVRPLVGGLDMRTAMWPKVYAPVDPHLYNTDPITQEMEKISGAQDAVQGGLPVEKTATEAQIMEAGRAGRTSARMDNLEEALSEMAQYVAQLAILTLELPEVRAYAGPRAVWPDFTIDEAFNLFFIEIKAGSTGKPKASSDREAWATLLPLIERIIDRIGHARLQGQEWAAAPWIALLHETARRLDDFADIEKFLPAPPPEFLQMMQNQEPSEAEKAAIGKDRAAALDHLSDAVEKNPLFFATPAYQVMKDALPQEEGAPAPEGEGVPPAPNPLPTGIN